MITAVLLFAAAGGTSQPVPAPAFNVAFPWVHGEVTAEALGNLGGFSPKSVQAFRAAVYQPDADETSVFQIPTKLYRADHHCDRSEGNVATSKGYFKSTAQYISDRKTAAVQAVTNFDTSGAVDELGRALHALQDCLAHSNYVDLAAADKTAFEAALLDPTKDPPETVQLTGYNPTKGDDEKLAGDPYWHREKAKDEPKPNKKKNNKESEAMIGGQTKFALARAAAVNLAESFLRVVENSVEPAEWNDIRELPLLNEEEEPVDAAYDFDCETPAESVSCSGTTVVLPSGSLPPAGELEVLGMPAGFFGVHGGPRQTADGATIALPREIRPVYLYLASPAAVEIRFLPADLSGIDPSTLKAYQWDVLTEEWQAVPDALVSLSGGVVSFETLSLGYFALGGEAVPVGGEAGLLDSTAPPAEAVGGSRGAPVAPIAAAVVAGVAAVAAGGWYARRRWGR